MKLVRNKKVVRLRSKNQHVEATLRHALTQAHMFESVVVLGITKKDFEPPFIMHRSKIQHSDLTWIMRKAEHRVDEILKGHIAQQFDDPDRIA